MKHEYAVRIDGDMGRMVALVIDQAKDLEEATQRAHECRAVCPYGSLHWRFWHTVTQVVENEQRARSGEPMVEINV